MTTARLQVDNGPIERSATRPTWWLIWSGIVLLTAPIMGTCGTVFSMIRTFQTIAASPAAPPPADVSDWVSLSLLLTAAGIALALVGIVLIVLGLVIRRPVRSS